MDIAGPVLSVVSPPTVPPELTLYFIGADCRFLPGKEELLVGLYAQEDLYLQTLHSPFLGALDVVSSLSRLLHSSCPVQDVCRSSTVNQTRQKW